MNLLSLKEIITLKIKYLSAGKVNTITNILGLSTITINTISNDSFYDMLSKISIKNNLQRNSVKSIEFWPSIDVLNSNGKI